MERSNKLMSNATATDVPVKNISTPHVRKLLDNKRPIQFWNVLTDEWFKGENISSARAGCRWAR
jgi:hypothetical protein